MNTIKGLFLGLALGVVAGSTALAGQPADRGDTPRLGWGKGGSKSHAVPGPVAGVGLAGLLGAAGYYWVVRRRHSRKGADTTT